MTADMVVYFVAQMNNYSILSITLEYGLNQLDDESLNEILLKFLSSDEKRNALMALEEERTKEILLALGFRNEFIKTL